MDINSKHIKSFKNEDNLRKALDKLGFADHRHVVVWTKEGRVTAVFPLSNIQDGNIMRYSYHGFMTLG
jgi:hypothetical protein